MVHTREKELREWELIIEKRKQKLLEKESQLKCHEEKVVKIQDELCSGEISRESNKPNGDCSSSHIQNENNGMKNVFLMEKEKLLLERERVISEKIENIELRERNILSKEKLFEDEKAVLKRETELLAETKLELDSREQNIKNNEESKLSALYEDKKATDVRIELLGQKENALSMASEIMQNKEKTLNERENMVIEKEKSIINLINGLNEKYILNEQPNRGNEILEKFDEIFNEKMKIIQQRENNIRKIELLLEEKWKKYSEAKELLKLEEENLAAMRDTFEKEKVILRGWENLLEKLEVDVTGKSKIPKVNERKESTSSLCFSEKEINVKGNDVIRDENTCSQKKTSDLEYKEISGNELFQLYEQERERLQNSMLNEKVVMPGKKQENSNTQNRALNENVRSFFNKIITPSRADNIESAPEVNGGRSQSSETVSVTKENENNILLETNTSNSAVGLNKVRSRDSCDQEAQITLGTVDAKIVGKSDVSVKDVNKENTNSEFQHMSIEDFLNMPVIYNKEMEDTKSESQHMSKEEFLKMPVIYNKETEDNFQKSNGSLSEEREPEEKGNAASPENDFPPDSSNRTSRSSSVSSAKSLTFPVSDQISSRLAKRQRKPPRDALLQAISKRDILEIVQLLEIPCISLKGRNDEGRTAFLLAVEIGNIELGQRLMNMGADIRVSDYRGSSALHIAVGKDNAEMVLFLLKNGLNPGVTDNNGNTVLQLASKMNNSLIVDIINKHISQMSS